MDNSPDKYISRLWEASNKKYKLLKEMLSLTQAQTNVITEDKITNLESIIAEKQILIDEINKLDEEFNVYFQRLKQTLQISNLDDLKGHNITGVKELQETISTIMGLIKEISLIEKQNSVKANQLLQSFGEEIKRLNQSKKVSLVYNTPKITQSPSYFIDKKK